MCTNKQIENNVHKSWKKEHFLGSFLACGIICVCLFYHDGPLFLGINATLESSCAVFLFGGAICTELLWINDLHEQYSQMVKRDLFIIEKKDHGYNNLPLIIATGGLGIAALNAANGNVIIVIMTFLTIILLLLVFGFYEQKRLYVIEDTVKEYTFTNSKDDQDSPTANK